MSAMGPRTMRGVQSVSTGGANSVEPPRIPHARLWFEMEAPGPTRLPAFLGSTLRGGLARAMRRVACVARRVEDCRECPFLQACTYALLFETPRPRWAVRYPSMTTIPHPLVIEPPEWTNPSEDPTRFGFAVRLFGRAVEAWAHLVVAARAMAAFGLGAKRARFDLLRACDQGPNGATLYDGHDLVPHASPLVEEGVSSVDAPVDAPVHIAFRTPTRLVEDGRLLRGPTWPALVRSIAFRAATIAYFHAGMDWNPAPVEEAALGDGVREVGSRIAWTPLRRFSTRQDQKVPLDGFTGEVTYDGPAVRAALPMLRLGEVLHVGKGTVFGLGWIRVSRG